MFKKLGQRIKNKKGFTLIELIVVIAILGILALIAIPRFMAIQDQSRLRSDAATAQAIINSARIQESQRNDGAATTAGVGSNWEANSMAYPVPQSGGVFALAGGPAPANYVVTWTPANGGIRALQTVTEGAVYVINR